MKWFILILAFNLTACANKPNRQYEYAPSGQCKDILCLSLAVAMSMSNNKAKKCSDMTIEQKKDCEAQVESLKEHIQSASKK